MKTEDKDKTKQIRNKEYRLSMRGFEEIKIDCRHYRAASELCES
jgi:hypothetical protein